MTMNTDCTYCGADKALHHYQTMQCPVNSREAAIGHRQEWMTTTFEIKDGSVARIAELEAENTQLRELVLTATVYFVADQSHKISWLNRALAAIAPKGGA